MSAEHYIECAKLSKDLVIDRRKLQWRINYIVWAAQGAVVYSALEHASIYRHLGPWGYGWLVFTLFATPVVFIFVHLLSSVGSNRKDLDLLLYFRGKARQEIGDPDCPTDVECPKDITAFSPFYALKWKRRKHWVCFVLPIGISITLSVGDMVAVSHARRPANGGLPRDGTREVTATTFRVLTVIDGDTFVIGYDGEPTSVRLWDIDAPGVDEPNGTAAAAELRRLIDDRQVRLVLPGPRKRDNFGRLLARVFVASPYRPGNDIEVSQAMLAANLAALRERQEK